MERTMVRSSVRINRSQRSFMMIRPCSLTILRKSFPRLEWNLYTLLKTLTFANDIFARHHHVRTFICIILARYLSLLALSFFSIVAIVAFLYLPVEMGPNKSHSRGWPIAHLKCNLSGSRMKSFISFKRMHKKYIYPLTSTA